jgi:hypothetical protein
VFPGLLNCMRLPWLWRQKAGPVASTKPREADFRLCTTKRLSHQPQDMPVSSWSQPHPSAHMESGGCLGRRQDYFD